MFKIIREKLSRIVWSNKTSKLGFLNINTNPRWMKKLIETDPAFICAVQGKAANLELLNTALTNAVNKDKLLIDALTSPKGIRNNPECMKKICEINGEYFSYAGPEAMTFENYLIAIKHLDPYLELYQTRWLMNSSFTELPKSEIEKFCQYNGSLLELLAEKQITKEIIDIAFSNPDPNKQPKISNAASICASTDLMKYACELDGINYIYKLCSDPNKELLNIALNHQDPNKKLTFDRIPKDFTQKLDYEDIKELINSDNRWLKYLNVATAPKDQIIKLIKYEPADFVTDFRFFSKYISDEEIMNAILEEAEKNRYTNKQLNEMMQIVINHNLIHSNCFEKITSILCKQNDVDYDFFKYHITRASKINDEILETLNFEILQPKYHKLYDDNGYEKLYTLTVYRRIQEQIISIAKPIKNGKVDLELGTKRLQLLEKLLKKATVDKNGNKIKDWIPYYNKIIYSFSKYNFLYNNIIENSDQMTDELLETLTNYVLGNHDFEIKNIEELKNYETIRENWLRNILERSYSYPLEQTKNATFEKLFGISLSTVKELLPYCQGILKSPNQFHPDIVDFFKTINLIMQENNADLLKLTISEFDFNNHLEEKDIIHLRSLLKKQFVKLYNETLFKVENKTPDDIFEGIKIYKAAGPEANQKFNISLTVLEAYASTGRHGPNYNYKEAWNQPKIYNHGICTSYIGNNNLAMAKPNFAILGFTDYEEDSLLLSGPDDIGSHNNSFDVTASEGSKSSYLTPFDMINATRSFHNEMVFERKSGTNRKRQPAYVVLVCDDYDKIKKDYELYSKSAHYQTSPLKKNALETDLLYHSLKAAKDFSIPIVVIERNKIAEQEYHHIIEKLTEFKYQRKLSRTNIREYYYEFITNLENNHISNYDNPIDKKYFNYSTSEFVSETIEEQIAENIKYNPSVALILIEELEAIIKEEKEKDKNKSHCNLAFDYNYLLKLCANQRKNIQRNITSPQYVSYLFDDRIFDMSNLTNYNQYVKNTLTEEQLTITDISDMLSESIINQISITINDIDKEALYQERQNGPHSRKHIENVILFSALIATDLNLPKEDLDLLLIAALYHDSGRTNDYHSSHGKEGSLVAQDHLEEKIPPLELKIIAAAIEYHEVVERKNKDGSINYSALDKICANLGMDTKDESLMQRTRVIANCLKDADALDRTRFHPTGRSFVRSEFLHYPISKKLIKASMQINEYYFSKEVEKFYEEEGNPAIFTTEKNKEKVKEWSKIKK